MKTNEIPSRVFFDTSVINFILEFGEEIFDNIEPENVTKRQESDIYALRKFFAVGRRTKWDIAISPFTYFEILKSSQRETKFYLENWFFDLWNYWLSNIEDDNNLYSFIESEKLKITLLSQGILEVFPDLEDRLLIIDAIAYKADCFCTRDWKTILKFRDSIEDIYLNILSPTELWLKIEPLSSLFY